MQLQDESMFGNMLTLYLTTVSTTLPPPPPQKMYILCSIRTATHLIFPVPCASFHSSVAAPSCAPTPPPSQSSLTLTWDSSHKEL